jgi:hypothetical protein
MYIGQFESQEKSANILEHVGRLFGRVAKPAVTSTARGLAPQAARRAAQLSLATAPVPVLSALAAARGVAVPASRMPELAKHLFNHAPNPRPPAQRPRMRVDGRLGEIFGNTGAERTALNPATARYNDVGLAKERLTHRTTAGLHDDWLSGPATAATSWGELKNIVPGSGVGAPKPPTPQVR